MGSSRLQRKIVLCSNFFLRLHILLCQAVDQRVNNLKSVVIAGSCTISEQSNSRGAAGSE